MSPAEQLCAAAAKLRDTATKATPGPWALLSYQVAGVYDEATDIVTDVAFTNGNQPNATWIALMSPAVAEPLADMLLTAAREWPAIAYKLEGFQALTLARAVLGEAP